MPKRSNNPQTRQRMRDKSVLDHLTTGPSKPDIGPKGRGEHKVSEADSRTLDKAIHEQWSPEKGGLPDF
jgi:hypothetical protein